MTLTSQSASVANCAPAPKPRLMDSASARVVTAYGWEAWTCAASQRAAWAVRNPLAMKPADAADCAARACAAAAVPSPPPKKASKSKSGGSPSGSSTKALKMGLWSALSAGSCPPLRMGSCAPLRKALWMPLRVGSWTALSRWSCTVAQVRIVHGAGDGVMQAARQRVVDIAGDGIVQRTDGGHMDAGAVQRVMQATEQRVVDAAWRWGRGRR